jgi:UrcA family protein
MNLTIHDRGFRRLSATVLSGVIASSCTVAPAAGAENLAAPQVRVTFGDLDVSRPQGAAVLYSRILRAAEKVCSPYWATSFAAQVNADKCVRAAIGQAVTTVDRPALSQIYSAKTRAPLALRSASLH